MVPNGKISSSFMAERCSCVCTGHPSFTHSSTDGHWGRFCILALLMPQQGTQGCVCLFDIVFRIARDKYRDAELLGHAVDPLQGLEEAARGFPSRLHQCAVPPAAHDEGSLFSTASPATSVWFSCAFSTSRRCPASVQGLLRQLSILRSLRV